MDQEYVVAWSTKTGNKGQGSSKHCYKHCLKFCTKYNEKYPDILHYPKKVESIKG